jgi:hypothetical protein
MPENHQFIIPVSIINTFGKFMDPEIRAKNLRANSHLNQKPNNENGYMMKNKGTLWHGVRIAAYFGFAFSLLFNLWSVELWLTDDGHLEWPHTMHVLIIQGGVFLVSVLGVLAYFNRARIEAMLSELNAAKQAALLFGLLFLVEIFLGVAFWLTQDHPGFSDWGYLHDMFHLNYEFNIPTLFSVAQLWLAAMLAFLCMMRTKLTQDSSNQTTVTWVVTSLVLLFLGFDELLSIHEDAETILVAVGILDPQFDNRLGGYGYAWTLVALPLAAAFGIWFVWRFFMIFQKRKRHLFFLILSGITFIAGAVFMENIQVYVTDAYQLERTPRILLMLEELLEMLGVSIAVYALYFHARELDEKRSPLQPLY